RIGNYTCMRANATHRSEKSGSRKASDHFKAHDNETSSDKVRIYPIGHARYHAFAGYVPNRTFAPMGQAPLKSSSGKLRTQPVYRMTPGSRRNRARAHTV